MKKKLKQWKLDLAAAKAAWTTAKKGKKATDEIKTLHDAYAKIAAVVDEAESNDAKEEDDVEVAAEEGKGKSAGEKEQTITSEELKTMLSETLATEIQKSLTEQQKSQVTNESVTKIVEEVLKKHSKDGGQTVPAADFKTIASEVVKEQMAQITKESKIKHDDSNDNHEGKSTVTIELPHALTKGNLPVHMKQLLNVMLRKDQNDGISAAQLAKAKSLGDRLIQKYVSMARNGQKALTSTGVGTGDEWVPTELSSELLRRFFLSSDLAAYMAAREIEMPTQPYELPVATTRPTFYLETTENVEATASTPGTSKLTMDAKKLMGRVDFSYEVEEDSILPILPFVQDSLSEAAAAAYESALINGDTAATHQDSDVQAVAKHSDRAFNGFRKLALAVAGLKKDLSTGGVSEANLRAMVKALGKYGARKGDLLWLTGSAGLNDIMSIANVATVDKYGPRATILTGELASFLGIPIIVSEAVREDLNASGVYDGVTTTKGSIFLVNTRYWRPGRRRDFLVEVDKDIKTQTKFVVASFRRAFMPIETPSAAVRSVVLGYNFNS